MESLLEFVKGGYKNAEEEKVSPPRGFLSEIIHLYTVAGNKAYQGIKKGNYFTPDVMFIAAPLIFVFILLFLIFAPNPAPQKRTRSSETSATGEHDKEE